MKRPFHAFLLPALLLLSLPLWGGEKEEASDFTLETLSGGRLSLSDRLGKEVIYLSFWATWCTPCKLEMGQLERLYRKYRTRGFTVIAVNVDDSETVSQVRPFVRQKRFTFPVVLDRDRQVAGRYDPAGVIPYGVLIDRNGKIVQRYMGFSIGDAEALEQTIEAHLSAGEAPVAQATVRK